jgi:hypothetical protein
MVMNEARPYASLSSGLLARKGAAKPAMRPQGYTGFEDLGWNDMGYSPELEPVELPEHVPSSIAALTPLPKNEEHTVAAQQRAIAESFDEEEEAAEALAEPEAETEVEAAPVPEVPRARAEVVALPKREPRQAAATGGRKTAFTLRLDTDRHLRLRLACAVTGSSAQQIVSNALDALLETIPEVEALAERVPASKRR